MGEIVSLQTLQTLRGYSGTMNSIFDSLNKRQNSLKDTKYQSETDDLNRPTTNTTK